MAFQQDTSRQGYSPDPSSRGQKGLGSRLYPHTELAGEGYTLILFRRLSQACTYMCTVFPLQYVSIWMLYSDLYHWLGLGWYKYSMDGFQMSIKRPTSGGQMHDQEVDISAPFTLRELYLSTLMVRTQCSTVISTQLHRMQTLTLALRK